MVSPGQRTYPTMDGHMCDIMFDTAGYGRVHIRHLPAAHMGALHDHSSRCSIASHDVPVTGHVPLPVLEAITGMVFSGTRLPDVRGCKAADGYIIHTPLCSDNTRGLYSIVMGSALHVESDQPGDSLEGHCSIYCIKPPANGSAFKPINVDLHDHLHELLQLYTGMPNQGGVTQGDICNCVGRVSRLTSVDHIGHCLRALSPLTTSPRVVFQTRGESPTVLMGLRCTPSQSTRIKGVFMGWLERMGEDIYEYPIPSDDADLREALRLPKDDQLWVTKSQGGLYIYDRPQGIRDRRLRCIVNSRDIGSGFQDDSAGNELQAHTFTQIGRLQFVVRGDPSECSDSTLECVGVPTAVTVQTAIMFMRNGFAQFQNSGEAHDPFHGLCRACVHGPGISCLDPTVSTAGAAGGCGGGSGDDDSCEEE
jgi:hypothetical protein